MTAKLPTSKWKSMLKKGRDDDGIHGRKAGQHKNTGSGLGLPQNRSSSFSDKYSATNHYLGEGDTGCVFMAVRKSNGSFVAVKQFRRQRNNGTEKTQLKKILAEFAIGSQLRHENIIQNIDLIEGVDGYWHQVMEYAPHNLFSRVSSGNMSPEEIDCSFAQIVSGVSYLHAAGFAHRDLKLENIVYTDAGVMKIIDFGVAVLCQTPEDKAVRMVTDLAGCGPYIAPEVLLRRAAYDPQHADVWSVAIMLCCMVLTRFPWKEAVASDHDFSDYVRTFSDKDSVNDSMDDLQNRLTALKMVEKDSASIDSGSDKSKSSNSSPCPTPCKLKARLLSKGLSEESWVIVSQMMHLDPNRRLNMRQVMNTGWIRSIITCSDLAHRGADGIPHTHTHH